MRDRLKQLQRDERRRVQISKPIGSQVNVSANQDLRGCFARGLRELVCDAGMVGILVRS